MKFITATLASFSLAAGLAMPTTASADNEDLARILAGIATVAIIAKIADDRKDRKREAAQVRQRINKYPHGQRWIEDGRPIYGNVIGGRHGSQGHQSFKSVRLPARCERLVSTPRGNRLVYGARCLNRNYQNANRLPDRCRVLVGTGGGNRPAYTARCLRRDGWNVARR